VDGSGYSGVMDSSAMRCGDGGVDGQLRWRSHSVLKLDGGRRSAVCGEATRACRQAEAQASGEVRQHSGVARSGF
jgi:hypothetical protein